MTSNDEDRDLQLALMLSLAESQNGEAAVLTERSKADEELELAIKMSLGQHSLATKTHAKSIESSTPAPPLTTKPIFDGTRLLVNRLSGFPAAANAGAVTFEQLLDKEHLQEAILTTFVIDIDWLCRLLPRKIPITIVKHWDRNSDKPGHFSLTPHITVVHPRLLGGWGNFHAKLMLLVFPTFLRVAICSANLTREDWSLLGQVVWCQDFPKMEANSNTPMAPFGVALKDFVTAMKISTAFLNAYDFSATRVDLIASVPGYYRDGDIAKYGHPKLASLVSPLSTLLAGTSVIDDAVYCQISSVGSLARGDWFGEFTESMCGRPRHQYVDTAPAKGRKRPSPKKVKRTTSKSAVSESGRTEVSAVSTDGDTDDRISSPPRKRQRTALQSVTTADSKGKENESEGTTQAVEATSTSTFCPPVQILFPTFRTVQRSALGCNGGGMLCLNEGQWNEDGFPRNQFCDVTPSPPARAQALLHSKVVARIVHVRPGESTMSTSATGSPPESQVYGWVYIGSHNLSPSAWGRYQVNYTQLHIANYELGVLFKVVGPNLDEETARIFPERWVERLPFAVPPREYAAGDVPWIMDKYLQGT